MSTTDVARDVISRVLDRDTSYVQGPQRGGKHRGFGRKAQQPVPVAMPPQYQYTMQQQPAMPSYSVTQQGGLPVYTAPHSGMMPPPLYQQQEGAPAPYVATRGMAVEYMPSRGSDTDFVNQAFSEALNRARQKWSFNLMIALVIAGLIILGVAISGVWMLMGQENALTALFGTGATIFGVLGWVLARPGSQLNDADNQVSLLMMIWTKYTQDLQGCERITDPSSAASCMAKAGDEAIGHFNSIVGQKTTS